MDDNEQQVVDISQEAVEAPEFDVQSFASDIAKGQRFFLDDESKAFFGKRRVKQARAKKKFNPKKK